MSLAREVKKLTKCGFDILPKVVNKLGYECQKIDELNHDIIMSNISSNRPIFVNIQNRSCLIYGIDEDCKNIYVEPGGKQDILNFVQKEAIVIYGFRGVLMGNRIIHEDSVVVPIGWSEMITRTLELFKNRSIPIWKLPDIPVLLTFKNKEDKSDPRGYSNGPTIEIYDIEDPLTVTFHEVGHVYYQDRLTEEEKKELQDHYSEYIDSENPGALFKTKYEASSSEEYFSTLYMWYIKGIVLMGAYHEILCKLDRWGKSFIERVFNRVEDKLIQDIINEEREQQIISIFTNDGMSKIISRGGYFLSKAKSPIEPITITDKHKVIGENNIRKWIYIESGNLSGKVIPLNKANNAIDFKYIKNNEDKFYYVPGKGKSMVNPYLSILVEEEPFDLSKANDVQKFIFKNAYVFTDDQEFNSILKKAKNEKHGILAFKKVLSKTTMEYNKQIDHTGLVDKVKKSINRLTMLNKIENTEISFKENFG